MATSTPPLLTAECTLVLGPHTEATAPAIAAAISETDPDILTLERYGNTPTNRKEREGLTTALQAARANNWDTGPSWEAARSAAYAVFGQFPMALIEGLPRRPIEIRYVDAADGTPEHALAQSWVGAMLLADKLAAAYVPVSDMRSACNTVARVQAQANTAREALTARQINAIIQGSRMVEMGEPVRLTHQGGLAHRYGIASRLSDMGHTVSEVLVCNTGALPDETLMREIIAAPDAELDAQLLDRFTLQSLLKAAIRRTDATVDMVVDIMPIEVGLMAAPDDRIHEGLTVIGQLHRSAAPPTVKDRLLIAMIAGIAKTASSES